MRTWWSLALVGFGCTGGGKDDGDGDTQEPTTDSDDTEDTNTDTDTDDTDDPGPADPLGERVFLGTGEYSPIEPWDAILRFDDAHLINTTSTSAGVDPAATVAVDEVTDGNGIALNFVHSLYLVRSTDEMYASSLFTTTDGHPCGEGLGQGADPDPTKESCGSIGVLANASSMTGAQTLSRHLYGDATLIDQAHGIWVDEDRDILYVANTALADADHQGILAFENASSADGNIAPDRHITFPGIPLHVYVDGPTDRMFVVTMGGDPSVAIFANASTLDGAVTPETSIQGPNTRLSAGNNGTTHNVWFIADHELVVVGHHTNEVLFYDVSGRNLDNSGVLDLAPRVLEVNEDATDAYDWSTYGFFYVRGKDRLYVSTGHTAGGDATHSGGPNPGGNHQVRVFDGVSDPSVSGRVAPNRRIHWTSWETYYPPQPLWVVDLDAP